MNPIALSIFSNRIESVCEEMGATLRKVAFSPNIKDRLDYSCAVFDIQGELSAQAAHIPVHLGSMAYAMRDIVKTQNWQAGDMVILNNPYMGGTHLPDVTVIAPMFVEEQLMGFIANRAHHADIGSESPGSMPISSHLDEEGLVISPSLLVRNHEIDVQVFNNITNRLKNPEHAKGDFIAQVAANKRGLLRLTSLIQNMGVDDYGKALVELNNYAETLALDALKQIPDGEYQFEDVMDDDGMGTVDIKIKVSMLIKAGRINLDFNGTDSQVKGNINCPLSVTAAAVYYVFRCLMPAQTPACFGSFRSIAFGAPEGCLLNAQYPAAVTAGNVETSTRIVDVVLGALAKALPEKIPAASHGSMNNLAMGSAGDDEHDAWDYYETIGGGMGASFSSSGLDAVQTHMTNTLNTPIEVLEKNYPLRINRYQIRKDSGGKGKQSGGDGIVREYEFLAPAQISLLTERRRYSPWGMKGGDDGDAGINKLNDNELPAKTTAEVKAGDQLIIETPGGGGYK